MSRPLLPSRRLFSLGLVLALLPASAAAQSIKLNGPLVQPLAGDVSDVLVSTDGARVVYRADQLTDDVFELFSAPIEGGSGGAAPVRLNGPLPAGGDVNPGPRAAGERIVYVAGQGTVFPLYSVPADGSGSPVRLSSANALVTQFWIAANGQFVVYLTPNRLFRVPTDGSAPPLDLTPVSGFYLGARAWVSPDGSLAVFTKSEFNGESLNAIPTDGSAASVELDTSSAACFCVVYFADLMFSSDGSRIVYADTVDHDGPIDVDLYSVPVDGSQAPVRLNLQALDGYYLAFQYDGGERVAFRDDALDLYSVRTDGTERVQLNPPGWMLPLPAFVPAPFSSDATHVVFLAESAGLSAIYSAPFDGSSSTVALVPPAASLSVCVLEILGGNVFLAGAVNSVLALVAVPVSGGDTTVLTLLQGCGFGTNVMALTPDGQELVFRQPRDVSGMVELYAVPVDGSLPARKVSAALIDAGDVAQFALTPAGERVVYRADQELDDTFELYGARLDGAGSPVKYNPSLAGGPVIGDVLAFQASPDRSRVAYLADQDTDEEFDLYAAKTSGRGAPKRLSEALGGSGDVLADFVFTPTGQRLVFQYDAAVFHLYGVPVDLGQPPVELDSSSLVFPSPFGLSPDGVRLVYFKPTSASDQILRSVPIDGSSPPVTLANPAGAQTVVEYELAPAGDVVVYRADQDALGAFEVYRTPTDGSAPPVKLDAALVTGGDVDAFRISPDSSRVVYRADGETDGVFELFAVPIDASAPALKLSSPMVTSGDVQEFSISPDSQRAVYRADQVVNAQFELFSVPVDASATALRLTVLSAGRAVLPDFQISPDGQRVFYRADAVTDSVVELFVVPIDGSAGPLRLSDTLVAGGDVTDFAMSPDQSRVVYLADQAQDQRFELFSVPADGSGPAVALDPLPSFGDVVAFRIDPDSARVVYTADRNADGVLELFAVPLDASSPPERLNRSLPAGADVESDFVPLPGGGVLYRADQEANDVLELWHFLDLDLGDTRLPSAAPTRSITVLR